MDSSRRHTRMEPRALGEPIPSTNLVIDERGTVRSITRSARALLGFDPDEMLDRNLAEYLHPDDLLVGRTALAELVAGSREAFTAVARVRRPDDTFASVVYSAAVIGADPARIGLTLGESSSIARAVREAGAPGVAPVTDLSRIAHDLLAPLRVMRGYAEMLEHADAGTEAKHIARRIARTAQRMQALVDSALELEGPAEAIALRIAPTDLREVVGGALELLAAEIEDAVADVQIGQLPTVDCDPLHMQRVFQNLVSNALKYRGGRPAHVEISGFSHERAWGFSVTDRGTGIAETERERIFEPGARGAGSLGAPGAGLGLAICRQILELHGGAMFVASLHGRITAVSGVVPQRAA